MQTFKLFKDFRKYVKKNISLKYPISIRLTRTPKDRYGDCEFNKQKKCFIIRISKMCSDDSAIIFLIHELAHCISFQAKEDHDEQFGKAYAEVYKIYEDWISSPEK